MGRHSTGAITTGEALRLELSYLIKQGYFQRGKHVGGSLIWSNQWYDNVASIHLYSKYPENGPIELSLIYQTTDRQTGETSQHNDLIYLEAVPSNLGKGEVLYFLCPQTGQRCRILYRCYNSPIWKSRTAYQSRIYYTSQQSSKREYPNNRYWQLDKQIEKLGGKRNPGTYRGKPTKRAKRMEQLIFFQRIADHARWQPEAMTLGLRRAFYGGLPGYEYLRKAGN